MSRMSCVRCLVGPTVPVLANEQWMLRRVGGVSGTTLERGFTSWLVAGSGRRLPRRVRRRDGGGLRAGATGATAGLFAALLLLTGTAAAQDTTPPTISSSSVSGATVTIVFNEALDTDHEPETGDFSVSLGGTSVTVDDVTVTGSQVELTLNALIAPSGASETTSVTYSNPGDSTALQDAATNQVATFTRTTFTNNIDWSAAAASDLSGIYAETLVDIRFPLGGGFSGLDTDDVPAASRFSVTVDGTPQTPTALTIRPNSVVNGSLIYFDYSDSR